MKNYIPYISFALIVLLPGCKKEEAPKPKVIYENSSKPKAEAATDTAQIEVADLPISMEGTNYLIHPIGVMSGSSKGVKSLDAGQGFTVSNYGEYQITGYLKNLKFQEIGTDSIYALTDKAVLIQTATYLKNFADKTKQQLMVYSLADMDTNKDGKLDSSDIESLYMSTISGQKFTKLSADYQELIDWKIIESKNLLYFRTIEDASKNGEFSSNDVVHYFYLSLNEKEWKPIEFFPLKN
ncbi:hypothetical protein [Flavobacterium sp.]